MPQERPPDLPRLKTTDFFYHDELDSSNSEALRKLDDPAAPAFFAIMAGVQDAGRGRRGSAWQSEKGNLHLTLAY
ncbi:MAG: hypothetical protein KBD78_12940, partial [Oligoflexales bacterium]|nr:hypothetical protein [Oligoflexales bacterium]